MKNLKLSLIAVAVLVLSSCNQFIQLIETESVGKDAVSKEGVCENADIRINYNMWSEDGVSYFSVYNKADKPMYIDWKRSVFIFNDWKYDYWVEVFPDAGRYTFIPPKAYVSVPMTYTLTNSVMYTEVTDSKGKSTITYSQRLKYLYPGMKKTSIPSSTKPSKNVKAYVKTYSQSESPTRFRNFLTYTFDMCDLDNCNKDFKFIENDFYVSKKTEMTTKNFNGKFQKVNLRVKVGSIKSKTKVKVFESPYRNGTSWYNSIVK